jgi:predicted amidophosphoribosyltransferase
VSRPACTGHATLVPHDDRVVLCALCENLPRESGDCCGPCGAELAAQAAEREAERRAEQLRLDWTLSVARIARALSLGASPADAVRRAA